MAQPSSFPGVASFEGLRAWVDDPTTIPVPAPYFLAAAFALAAIFLFLGQKSASNIPHLNPRKLLEVTDIRSKKEFLFGSRSMLSDWFRDHPDKPARVIGDAGEVTILPPHLTNEIRNDPRLSFSRWVFKVRPDPALVRSVCRCRRLIVYTQTFHAHLPGFEGFREGSRESHIVQDVIVKDLTKYLSK